MLHRNTFFATTDTPKTISSPFHLRYAYVFNIIYNSYHFQIALAGSTQVINSSSVPPQPVVLTQPPLIVSSTNAMSLGANATMPIPTTSTSVISATSMNAAAPSAISRHVKIFKLRKINLLRSSQ